MDNTSAPSNFQAPYMTVYQVFWWILDRDPRGLEKSDDDFALDDADLTALRDKIAGKAVAESRSLDALLQLLAALESGRVKATGRRKWVGNPRWLPKHFWSHLTLANRTGLVSWIENTQTCACYRAAGRRDYSTGTITWTESSHEFWSDLRFDRKGVLTVWPQPTDREQADPKGSSKDESEQQLRPAPDPIIHKTISEAYDESDKRGSKPPNVKEIVKPVQKILRDNGYSASGKHIQDLAQTSRHVGRRRKPGVTVASENRRKR